MISALDLPPIVRARVELWRERVASGMVVTCGGVSMEPSIRRGDAVSVRAGRPRVGEVAAFVTRRGQLELHRLVARVPVLGWWVHAGDNQAAPHLGLVHDRQLVGVVDGAPRPPSWSMRARAAARVARAAARRLRQR